MRAILILSIGCAVVSLAQADDTVSPTLGKPWKRHAVDRPDGRGGADGVRLRDVNGDGLLDITTGWEEAGRIRVYIHPGHKRAGQAWPAVTVGKVGSPEDAVFADLDGDGAVDVVSSSEGRTRAMHVHWAPRVAAKYLDSTDWTTAPIPTTAGTQWMFALSLDIDGQNGIDLVVGSKGAGAKIGWLQSPADPRDLAAWKFHPLVDAGWIMSLQGHDMDGDGDLDVLASDRKGPRRGIFWLENPGPESTGEAGRWKEHRLTSNDGLDVGEVMFLARADLDGDSRQDVVCAVRGGPIAWLRATGDARAPWKHYPIPLPDGCGGGKGVGVGDIDGDGHQDIVFSCEGAAGQRSGARWLSYVDSPRSGRWQDHEISGPAGVKFDRLELLDLDGDGDLDVLTCEERDDLGVIWYENPR